MVDHEPEQDPLRASYLQAIFEESNDGILIIDPVADEILEANPKACELLGFPRDRLLSTPLSEIHRHEMERFRRFVESVEEQGKGWTAELSCMTASRGPIPVEISASVVDFEGRRCMVALIRDISQRKQVEEEQRRMLAELREIEEERWRLLARLVSAHEEERRRTARALHDDAVQVMSAVGMRLGSVRQWLTEAEKLEEVTALEGAVAESIARLRDLTRELRPPELDREGLGYAVRLALERASERAGFEYHLEDALVAQPPLEIRRVFYRIALEALTNVRKHARARRVEVALENRDDGVFGRVADDGDGFVPEQVGEAVPAPLGISSMLELAELMGGWCRIESAPGAGTTVEFWLPTGAAITTGRSA